MAINAFSFAFRKVPFDIVNEPVCNGKKDEVLHGDRDDAAWTMLVQAMTVWNALRTAMLGAKLNRTLQKTVAAIKSFQALGILNKKRRKFLD